MSRIEGVPDKGAGIFRRFVFWMTRRKVGKVVTPVRVTSHSRAMLMAVGSYEMWLEKAKKVSPKLKELAQIQAARMVGCPFWIDIGSALGKAHGITEQQLREMDRYRDSDAFDEKEKLVVELAEEMTRTPVNVPDELFDKLRACFDAEQLVELIGAIAWENHRARFNHAFGIEAEGFDEEGAVCLLPVRAPKLEAQR